MSASRWMTGIRPTIWSCCTGCTTIWAHGGCYYIEYCGTLVGDISLRDSGELAIVVCKEYQNRHIGRHGVLELLKLAKEEGHGAGHGQHLCLQHAEPADIPVGWICTDG